MLAYTGELRIIATSHMICAVFKFRYFMYLVPDQIAGPWSSSEGLPSWYLPLAYTVPAITLIQGSQTARERAPCCCFLWGEEGPLLESASAHNYVTKGDPRDMRCNLLTVPPSRLFEQFRRKRICIFTLWYLFPHTASKEASSTLFSPD